MQNNLSKNNNKVFFFAFFKLFYFIFSKFFWYKNCWSYSQKRWLVELKYVRGEIVITDGISQMNWSLKCMPLYPNSIVKTLSSCHETWRSRIRPIVGIWLLTFVEFHTRTMWFSSDSSFLIVPKPRSVYNEYHLRNTNISIKCVQYCLHITSTFGPSISRLVMLVLDKNEKFTIKLFSPDNTILTIQSYASFWIPSLFILKWKFLNIALINIIFFERNHKVKTEYNRTIFIRMEKTIWNF